ncbi:heme-binding protein 2-like [Abrus precatorius]|uniref:Heme-binding protein 2-like n=1 Tax=Abrus precatorius TaxID=3816 RepID=A0A8B8LN74_ABRPR|nr:heme-binding protein 2-like [Abrus precatorius]
MATTSIFLFSLLSSLLLVSFSGVSGEIPNACKNYECPHYTVVEKGNGYEIRRYDSLVLISNSPVQGDSFVEATRDGFIRLFSYIHGDNNKKQKIKMTAPVITQVSPSNGNSTYDVSFYVPKANQANPPLAKGLGVVRIKSTYAAIRQFGGFVTDSNVGKEVEALSTSLAGTKWSSAVQKSYAVGQYNAPYELTNRVNEIWFLFKTKTELHAV